MGFVIENEYLTASVSCLGATLLSFVDKQSGKDIVLGYKKEEDYLKYATNAGASVGRNANRIANAEFSLNNKTYYLTANDGLNQLHGGVHGFAYKTWQIVKHNKDEIIMSYESADGEEGFPGNLKVEVSYKLDNNNLIWSYKGKSDKDTILNMTNHSYFNLQDEGIFNHYLTINTDKYCENDENYLAKSKHTSVNNTPYDFANKTKLKDRLALLPNGIDNNYVYESLDDKLMASLSYDSLKLNVYSDLPDMHVYTGTYMKGSNTKSGKDYKPYDGICLECQYYPNAINYDDYIKPILKKGETMSHYIRYEIVNI